MEGLLLVVLTSSQRGFLPFVRIAPSRSSRHGTNRATTPYYGRWSEKCTSSVLSPGRDWSPVRMRRKREPQKRGFLSQVVAGKESELAPRHLLDRAQARSEELARFCEARRREIIPLTGGNVRDWSEVVNKVMENVLLAEIHARCREDEEFLEPSQPVSLLGQPPRLW